MEQKLVRQIAKEEFDKFPNSIDDAIAWHWWKIAFDVAARLWKQEPTIQQNTDYIAFLEEQLGDSCNWYEEFEASKTK